MAAGSWIGAGARFDGQTTLALPQSLAIDPVQGFTFEAWIKPRDLGESGVVYANQAGNTGLVIGLDKGAPYVEVTSNGTATRSQILPPLNAGWSHIAVSANAQSITLYLNGLPAATLAVGSPPITAGGVLAGSPPLPNLRARWMKCGSPPPPVRRTTSGPLTPPPAKAAGWWSWPHRTAGGKRVRVFWDHLQKHHAGCLVVIAVLAAMGVMSWFVMWAKGVNAGRTARANRAFLAYPNEHKGDVLALEEGLSKRDLRELTHSSLYRLYKVGQEELSARREELGGAPLSEENLAAIRASLDAALVEENQKLDSSMVLLTISIAGAPFIGLLGTVLGVMITFAAIAAAGDVNVNAIAPGISAALFATVAGLAVAIPALFGYNYISSINSAIAGQTQIFGDRLITRFAEWQRHGAAAE